MDAICGNHDDDGKILGLLQGAVRAYEAIWQYVKKPFVADVEARLAAQEAEPAFMARLNPESRLRMRRLAAQSEFGWLHPGLLLVGETWAYVWNKAEDLPWDYRVETWGLLAKVDHTSPDGVVARLTLEREPGRCGAFYPHPLSGGYLPTDRSFQDALQNAWWAVIGRDPAPFEFDVRWSLSVEDRSKKLPLDVDVKHRSMEAALACALKAVLAGAEQGNRRRPRAIIGSYHTSPGYGLPIGALTSQHFANFYLGSLDRFVKETLRADGYAR